jgi:hypothetical protein
MKKPLHKGSSRKLSNQWIRPYAVIEVDKANAIIKKERRVENVGINRLKPF